MTSLAEPTSVAALSAELTGSLLAPGSTAYAEEIAAFNTAVVHRPDLVVGAANTADVQVALSYAAAHGLPVGVQATGHGATEPVAAGVLISTRRLDSLGIDPVARTATVGAGVAWREGITAAALHGLAPLSGSSSDVSAVGYPLGGGLPVMGRTFGFAADRVRAFDVVTPDGAGPQRLEELLAGPEGFDATASQVGVGFPLARLPLRCPVPSLGGVDDLLGAEQDDLLGDLGVEEATHL